MRSHEKVIMIPTVKHSTIGFKINPSQILAGDMEQSLQRDMESLLSSLTYNPPQITSTTLDLRYLVENNPSLVGKRFDVALLVCITFDSAKPSSTADTIESKFSEQFYNLLALHLSPYGFLIEPLSKDQVNHYLQPFDVVDIVEIARRITSYQPFELNYFNGKSSMTKIVDMLYREPGQYYLTVLLEPYQMTKEEIDTLKFYGYVSKAVPTTLDRALLDVLPELQAQAKAMFPSFRMRIRLASNSGISQYLVNLVSRQFN